MPADILIFDPARLSRAYLVSLVRHLHGSGNLHEADTPEKACAMAPNARIYFIAIESERDAAFGFARRIPDPERAALIFFSSSAACAPRAFDHAATDYLLNPIVPERLEEAWRRAIRRIESEIPAPTFPLETPTGIERLDAMHLLCVEALGGNSVRLHLRDGRRPLMRCSYKKWLINFPRGILVECSRGIAVNARHARALSLNAAGFFIRLSDDRTLRVSRRRHGELRDTLMGVGLRA